MEEFWTCAKINLVSPRLCLSGLITPGGFSSVPAGMETPELIELRKKKIEEAMDGWVCGSVREKRMGVVFNYLSSNILSMLYFFQHYVTV